MSSLQVIHKIIKPSSPLGVGGTLRLNERLILFNHATRVIDVIFAGRVGRQKGLRQSAWVSRLKKIAAGQLAAGDDV
jgi:hypothetical protein